jgi:hypothetical protein
VDQTTLGRVETAEPVSCEAYDELVVHYLVREAPHARYPFPVLCRVSGGPAVVGWVRSHVDHTAIVELRAGMGLQRLLSARLDWIAQITFVRVR